MIFSKLNPEKIWHKKSYRFVHLTWQMQPHYSWHTVYTSHTHSTCPPQALFQSNEGNNDSRPINWTTHTHPFNGPFSGTTRVSRYQKGKTNLDFTEARDSEWQWHQLGHTQVCISLQTDNHASTPLVSFFTGRMPFRLPNQQHQSTEGTTTTV